MNPIGRINAPQLLRAISAKASPSTLTTLLASKRAALRGMIGYASPERIAKLQSDIDMLEQRELAEQYAAEQELVNDDATGYQIGSRILELFPTAEYPPELLAARRAVFVEQVRGVK